jgi:hypothetical protein
VRGKAAEVLPELVRRLGYPDTSLDEATLS